MESCSEIAWGVSAMRAHWKLLKMPTEPKIRTAKFASEFYLKMFAIFLVILCNCVTFIMVYYSLVLPALSIKHNDIKTFTAISYAVLVCYLAYTFSVKLALTS